MVLDRLACDRARRSRDARFDGRFFIGVTTTRVYCRPICPARAPKDENVRYFPTAAAAEAAGFRPCLRCRPEASPGTPAWSGTSGVVSRALGLIGDGVLDETGVDGLSERVGLTARHLRRLFAQHLGATPLEVALTRRAHFAKQLLDETSLSCGQIATAAGFGSVRRFNSEVRRTFHRTPTELRRLARAPALPRLDAIVFTSRIARPTTGPRCSGFFRHAPRRASSVCTATPTRERSRSTAGMGPSPWRRPLRDPGCSWMCSSATLAGYCRSSSGFGGCSTLAPIPS